MSVIVAVPLHHVLFSAPLTIIVTWLVDIGNNTAMPGLFDVTCSCVNGRDAGEPVKQIYFDPSSAFIFCGRWCKPCLLKNGAVTGHVCA